MCCLKILEHIYQTKHILMGLKFLYEQQYKFKKVILFAMMQNY